MSADAWVRGAMLASIGLVVTAGVFLVVRSASPGGEGVGTNTYYGARILPPGPASNGLPLIPVRERPDGTLEADSSYLSWYARCLPGSAAMDPNAPVTNTFVYHMSPSRLRALDALHVHPWDLDHQGAAARASDFNETWQAASVEWRREGMDPAETPRAILMRVDPSLYPAALKDRFFPTGIAAFDGRDTHYCCEVSWRIYSHPRARTADGDDLLYDSCHDDRYDPRDIRAYATPPGPNILD